MYSWSITKFWSKVAGSLFSRHHLSAAGTHQSYLHPPFPTSTEKKTNLRPLRTNYKCLVFILNLQKAHVPHHPGVTVIIDISLICLKPQYHGGQEMTAVPATGWSQRLTNQPSVCQVLQLKQSFDQASHHHDCAWPHTLVVSALQGTETLDSTPA